MNRANRDILVFRERKTGRGSGTRAVPEVNRKCLCMIFLIRIKIKLTQLVYIYI